MKQLVWLRNDLRVSDNPALQAASLRGPTTCVFLIDVAQWESHDMSPWRLALTLRNVDAVSEQLAPLGINLLVRNCNTFAQAPEIIVKCAKQIDANCVSFNAEIALNEQRRDVRVETALEKSGLACQRHHNFTHLPPGAVTKPDGSSYTVFTPFKKRWLAHPLAVPSAPLPPPDAQGPPVQPARTPDQVGAIKKSFGANFWDAGEVAAQQCLTAFLKSRAELYNQQRDLPDRPGTSKLSAHLVAGTISAGQCLYAAYCANKHRLCNGNEGIDTWISELVWREFYNHILAANPRLSRGEAFRRETEQLQ